MSSGKVRRRDLVAADKEDTDTSILARLVEELQQRSTSEDSASDVTILFCGVKRSGKTSLVERFINPDKDEKDQPKPTIALDYKYARYAVPNSSSKILAHIYDLGGDESNDELVGIPVSAGTVGHLVLAVAVDLSEPHGVFPALQRWLQLLRREVAKSLEQLQREGPPRQRQAEQLQRSRAEAYAENPDREAVQPFPVPLVILGLKWDLLVAQADPEKRKNLCKALRHFAHVNGASLLFSSLKEKASLKAVRSVLQQLLFQVGRDGKLEQLDASKPLCVLAGRDSLAQIGPAPGGARDGASAWAELISAQFPDPQPLQRGAKRSDGEQVGDELLRYPEASIDGMVEQRIEELQQYRRQVERNQRLASEGVDTSKLGALTT